MSTAMEIAALFDNDGQVFKTADGREFWEVIASYPQNPHLSVTGLGDADKIVFSDGSAIIACGAGWDFALDAAHEECLCWADPGAHEDRCPLSEESIARNEREDELLG